MVKMSKKLQQSKIIPKTLQKNRKLNPKAIQFGEKQSKAETISQQNQKRSTKKMEIGRRTYIIAHEKIIGIRRRTTDPKKLNKIVKLAMNIAADGNRTFHRLNIPLLHQNTPRLLTQHLHLRLRQRFTLHQLLDLMIDISGRRHLLLLPTQIPSENRSTKLTTILDPDALSLLRLWNQPIYHHSKERCEEEEDEEDEEEMRISISLELCICFLAAD